MSESTPATYKSSRSSKSNTNGPSCPLCTYDLEKNGPLTFEKDPVYCGRAGCGVQLIQDEQKDIAIRTFRLKNHQTLCIFPFAFGKFDKSGCLV